MSLRPPGRRVAARLFGPALLALVLAVLLTVYLVRFRIWVGGLRFADTARSDAFACEEFPLLDRRQVTQLGAAHREGQRPSSSYTLADPDKKEGVFRIGVFGCSFVKGSEAGPGRDFPSQLEGLYHSAGRGEVEVLNFGVGGFGLQQSFLLWSYLAGDFDLDLTIVSLYGFHRSRDTSFVMLDTIHAPVHGRHIVVGGRLELVEVAGHDRREAAARYFSPLPVFAYLRYDRRAPVQLRALLPHGRALPANPFYYRPDVEAELEELYRLMLGEMAAASRRFVVLANDPASVRLANQAGLPAGSVVETSVERWTWRRPELHRAPRNHPSALGYRALAGEVFAALTGGEPSPVRTLGADLATTVAEPGSRFAAPASYAELWITVDRRPAGVLVRAPRPDAAVPFSCRAAGIAALLDVSRGGALRFVALTEALDAERRDLELEIDREGGGTFRSIVARVVAAPGGTVGVTEPVTPETRSPEVRLHRRPGGAVTDLQIATELAVAGIRLRLGDDLLLTGEIGEPANPPMADHPVERRLRSAAHHPRRPPPGPRRSARRPGGLDRSRRPAVRRLDRHHRAADGLGRDGRAEAARRRWKPNRG